MALNPLPLCYCGNVHPGRTLTEVEQSIDGFTVEVRNRLSSPLAAGLWFADPVARELLAKPDGVRKFSDRLGLRGLICYTLNAFPFGDFHSARVKDGVYLPDWSQPARLEYTWNCARILSGLLPDGVAGSISTLPLGFKDHPREAGHEERCIDQLLTLASWLHQMKAGTDRTIRLAIEPEPFCLIETTSEAVSFFHRLFEAARQRDIEEAAREHLGLCYDVCHQAVEFEDAGQAIRTLTQSGIRINKVQLSCAIELQRPLSNPAAREVLARYAEPRYLHQTFARQSSGALVKTVDLTESLALDPPPEFRDADVWRVHFHVPVNAESIGPLGTTRAELKRALEAIAALDDAPHLEIETYTWEVLPGEPADLVAGLTQEVVATKKLLEAIDPTWGATPE